MNTDITIPQNLGDLDKSIFIARHISSAIEVLRPLVYKVFQEKLWEGRFSSFAEYIESPDGLNRSQGHASKLRQVEEFRLEHGFAAKDLAGIDQEKLYLSIKAGGTPQDILDKARTLPRSQLRKAQEDTGTHEHSWILVCAECWAKKED